MEKAAKNKRGRLLVNKELQYRFLGAIVLLELFIAALAGPITLAFYTFAYDPDLLKDSHVRFLLIVIALAFFAATAVLLFIGLSFSNRACGPVHRTKEVLRSIGQGQLPQSVHFRKKDFHTDLAVALNEVLGTLRQSRESEVNAWREHARKVSELASSADATLAEKLNAIVADASARADDLDKSLREPG